jgi:hypothetical protein
MKSIIKLSGFLLLSTGTMGATIQELSDQCDGLRGELITAMNNVKLAERNHVAAEAGFEAAAAAASSAVSAYQFANDVSSLRRQMKSGRPHALRAFGKQNAGLHNGVCSGNIDSNQDVDCSSGKPSKCVVTTDKVRDAHVPCPIDADETTCVTTLKGGQCEVKTSGTNLACPHAYTEADCNDLDDGGCVVRTGGGVNSHCASETTRAGCIAASTGTDISPISGVANECTFSPAAANDCEWNIATTDLDVNNHCVFSAGDPTLTINAGPNVRNGGGSVNAQRRECCTDRNGVVNDKFVFEIGDYKTSFERYEKIYDDLFKIKEDIKQQESSACGAYAAAAAALTA